MKLKSFMSVDIEPDMNEQHKNVNEQNTTYIIVFETNMYVQYICTHPFDFINLTI